MELFTILVAGIASLLLGRILLKRWFNHLTVYSFFWTASLACYTLRLIEYYNISPEAWFYIGISWFMLYLGTFVVIWARSLRGQADDTAEHEQKSKYHFSRDTRFLSKTIIILSILSSITIIYQFLLLIRTFGSIAEALIQANLIYGLRVSGELSGIPYLGSFPLAATCLAGIYTALRKKITFLSILPFVLAGVHGILVMGRWDLVISVYLFLTTLLYTPHERFIKRKTIIAFLLVAILVLGMFTLISSARQLKVHFRYESQRMKLVRSSTLFLPSLYFYFSAPPVAFSEYLYTGEEKFYPGSYTFKSVYNILAKFDLADPLPLFNPWISTPESINAGTYLREIHADFGPLGVIIFPYVLGIILTVLYLKISHRPTTIWIVLFAHLFVVIFHSWSVNVMKHGQWVVSIVICLIVAWKLDSIAKEP